MAGRFGASYGPRWSQGEGTSACTSPTASCAGLRNELTINGLTASDPPLERVCPECILGGAIGNAGRIAGALTGPIKSGFSAFASSAGLSCGINLSLDVAVGIPFDFRTASVSAVGSGFFGLGVAGPMTTTAISLGNVGAKAWWTPTSLSVGQGISAAGKYYGSN